MRLMIGLLVLALLVGCSSARIELNDLHAKVLQADKEWAGFRAIETPDAWQIASVDMERRIYQDALDNRKDAEFIRRAGWNYIQLVYDMMIPPLPEPGLFPDF